DDHLEERRDRFSFTTMRLAAAIANTPPETVPRSCEPGSTSPLTSTRPLPRSAWTQTRFVRRRPTTQHPINSPDSDTTWASFSVWTPAHTLRRARCIVPGPSTRLVSPPSSLPGCGNGWDGRTAYARCATPYRLRLHRARS